MSKDTVVNMIEKGFYSGAAAAVGVVAVCAAPEIAIAVTLGVVAYRSVDRLTDTITDFRAFLKTKQQG